MNLTIPRSRTTLVALLTFAGLLAAASGVRAQGTAFTYQGFLTENGAPYTGSAELQPTLWDAASSGAQVAANSPARVVVSVTNGLFTTTLDFAGQFPGMDRWLQLEVRTVIGPLTTLAPRQKVTATPYAITAGNVAGPVSAGQLSGTLLPGQLPAGVVTNGASGVNVSGTFSGDGLALTNVNAATLNGLSSTAFWGTKGNWGAHPTNGAFLGTPDTVPFEIRVDNRRALRLEPYGDSPNLIAGSHMNSVGSNLRGASIGGGGSQDLPNQVNEDFACIPGGLGNTASGRASVAMGFGSMASGNYSTAWGSSAEASRLSAMAFGSGARAIADNAVALGKDNLASGVGASAFGIGAIASGFGSATLGSGCSATGERAVAIGFTSLASGGYSTAIGHGAISSGLGATAVGRGSVAAGDYSFAGGRQARANHSGSIVWADGVEDDFTSTGQNQFLIRAYGGVGINTNNPRGAALMVNGDQRISGANTLEFGAGVVGKEANAGKIGYETFTPGTLDIVGAGTSGVDRKLKLWAEGGTTFAGPVTVSSSYLNVVGAGNEQAYLGGDGIGGDIEIGSRSVGIMTVGFWNSAAFSHMNVVGLSFTPTSDRNAKENFAAVDPAAVLAKVAALPLSAWNYKADPATRHIGPMAQDFHAVFGVGPDDKHIATVDADGVALAAIQGLNRKLLEELQRRDGENAALLARVERLERLLSGVAAGRELSGTPPTASND